MAFRMAVFFEIVLQERKAPNTAANVELSQNFGCLVVFEGTMVIDSIDSDVVVIAACNQDVLSKQRC